MSPRIASAPVSYGVFEITIGRPGLPGGDELAGAIAAAGYEGTELGPPGYFGDGAGVAELLAAHGLALVASFLPLRFADRAGYAEDAAALEGTLELLETAAVGGELPRVLLSGDFIDPKRLAFAGRIEQHREAWLSDRGFAEFSANLMRAAERCRDRGFEAAFHHHAGTYIETPREIARLVEGLDHDLIGLCFDTGHAAFGGGEPLTLLREYRELVTHLHLKDVDEALLADIHGRGAGLETAWEEGVFCELGTGSAQVADCLEALLGGGYDGWIVVEQDRILRPDQPFSIVLESAERNRAFLRERGL